MSDACQPQNFVACLASDPRLAPSCFGTDNKLVSLHLPDICQVLHSPLLSHFET